MPFDQQPLEAQATIDACAVAYAETSDPRWIDEALRAYHWFLGANDLDAPLASPRDGGCFDGLMTGGVNRKPGRPDQSRVGQECVSQSRYGWAPSHSKKKT